MGEGDRQPQPTPEGNPRDPATPGADLVRRLEAIERRMQRIEQLLQVTPTEPQTAVTSEPGARLSRRSLAKAEARGRRR